MNAKLKYCAAALLACAAATFAFAQDAATPIASTTKSAADAGPLGVIAQALNADASLKGTKITVQTDGEAILLTGAANTTEQVKHATQIATAGANGAPVVNVIQADHTTYEMPNYDLTMPAAAKAG